MLSFAGNLAECPAYVSLETVLTLIPKGVGRMKAESEYCKSVFKNGAGGPDGERFTQLWIDMIVQMERSKSVSAGTE